MKKGLLACKASAVLIFVNENVEHATIWQTISVHAGWFLVAIKDIRFLFETLDTSLDCFSAVVTDVIALSRR